MTRWARIAALEDFVQRHYRDRLSLDDLRDPGFMNEAFAALEALERLIGAKGFYELGR